MFYFLLGILILTEGASLYWKRRFFGVNRGQYYEVRPPNINRQFWEVEPLKIIKYIFLFSIFIIFSLLFFQSWLQYRVWSQNEVSKFLLPPHQSIAYFLGYSFTHFFKNHLISLVVALLFSSAAVFFNKKFQERFFEKEEPYLGALAIFLVGHPFWIYYFITILIIGVSGTLFLRIINLRTSDVPTSDVPNIERNFRTSEVEALKTTNSILRGRTSVANKNQYLGSPTSRTSDVQILKGRFSLYRFWLPIAILVLIIGKILL